MTHKKRGRASLFQGGFGAYSHEALPAGPPDHGPLPCMTSQGVIPAPFTRRPCRSGNCCRSRTLTLRARVADIHRLLRKAGCRHHWRGQFLCGYAFSLMDPMDGVKQLKTSKRRARIWCWIPAGARKLAGCPRHSPQRPAADSARAAADLAVSDER